MITLLTTHRRKRRHAVIGFAALSLLGLLATLPTSARAQTTFYPNDATINTAVTGDAIVGYANQTDYDNSTNRTSPTVGLVTGGSISGYLYAFNSSTVNITGGSIGDYLESFNSSTLNISGGSISTFLESFDTSTVNISGGSIGNTLFATDNSTVTVSGGTFGQTYDYNFYNGNTGGFTLVGYNLMATNPRAYNGAVGGTNYDLSGTLLDGTDLRGYVINVQPGAKMFTLQNVTAVPEPGSVGLLVGLVTVGAGLVRKRRRS